MYGGPSPRDSEGYICSSLNHQSCFVMGLFIHQVECVIATERPCTSTLARRQPGALVMPTHHLV